MADFVYVSNADSREIMVLRSAGGGLVPVQSVAVSGAVMPMAVSPNRKFLYAALRSAPFLASSFAIDPASGRLSHIGDAPLADSMAGISTDRSGRYLLSASYGGHRIAVNPIGADGAVGEPQQAIATPPHAHQIVVDLANRYALSTSLGGDRVMLWRFDASAGTLAPNEPASVAVQAKSGPRHLRFHPNGRFVYLLCELDGSLRVFDWDAAAGTLVPRHVASALPPGFSGKPWAADLHLTPDGRFLYASERTSSTLTAYRVDGANGMLETVGSYATEQTPRGFAVDTAGRHLYAVGQASHCMASYAIDPATGALAPLARYPMGRNPNWVEIVALP